MIINIPNETLYFVPVAPFVHSGVLKKNVLKNCKKKIVFILEHAQRCVCVCLSAQARARS